MARKLSFLTPLAAGCLLSTGAAFAGSFTAPTSGQMTLWVNTSTGDVEIVGNAAPYAGYKVASAGSNLITSGWLKPMTTYYNWFPGSPSGAALLEGVASGYAHDPASPPFVVANQSTGGYDPSGPSFGNNTANVFDLGVITNPTFTSVTANQTDLSFYWLANGATSQSTGTVQYGTVPEPATLGLLAAGGLGLLARRRKSLA